jgi:hypothetical protein
MVAEFLLGIFPALEHIEAYTHGNLEFNKWKIVSQYMRPFAFAHIQEPLEIGGIDANAYMP